MDTQIAWNVGLITNTGRLPCNPIAIIKCVSTGNVLVSVKLCFIVLLIREDEPRLVVGRLHLFWLRRLHYVRLGCFRLDFKMSG